MNEGAKTGIYWAVALVMLVVAIAVTRPPETENPTESIVGQPLFPAFTDPLSASILRITTYNEEQSELAKFEVAKDEATGVWSLPSRNNYPADAAEQMKDAANALVNLKVLDIQTDDPTLHSELGVLEPNAESLEAGDEGVGRMVLLKGQNNTTLASIIIGKPVKDRESQRYVRVPGQDPVYVVAINDKPLSTNFADWIEKDLLQLSSIDINEVELQNYDAALEVSNQLSLERHYDAKASLDGTNLWKLDSLTVYDDAGLKKDAKLEANEKLSTTKLNALKNALDELNIVDVAAKPKGMSESLKADKELVSDQQAVLSLASRGFFPVTQGDILSANGEMQVTLKDGVQYVLRFGNVKGVEETKKEDGKEAGKAEAAKTSTVGANRYLLVTTRVDESKFPPPELATIPKTIEELEAMEAKAAEPATKSEESGTTKQSGEGTLTGSGQGLQADDETESTEAAKDEPADKPSEEKPAEEQPAEEKPADAPEQDAKPATEADGDKPMKDAASAEAPADDKSAEETVEEKQERLESVQEKLTKENQRKLDERKDRLEAARRRVRELNGRFAAWYYVIPEDTYRKLRLNRDELIEKPLDATSGAGGAADGATQSPSFSLPGLPAE